MNMRQLRLTRRLCGVALSPRRIGLVGSSQQARVQYAAAASNAAATEPQTFTITTPLYYVNAGAWPPIEASLGRLHAWGRQALV